ncbi:DUF1292 domain-containing protein [Clostridium cellulovorans]|uniref:DUF1292 domain-containing protein n=1 Tax=Clostridium cellulovorans (strain ATCC 35296 / DSM 3052 / OCM 3 / 743B) TaxID=573061 RepID=D9SKD3_CLOC7|nr:DUF1292 domain-containing protein [Clostridium cellulovorans]ADL51429.1 protein of unknown function DUF1292 [Clostridium cellulovorans 743B]
MNDEIKKDNGCNCHEDTCDCGGHEENHECNCAGHDEGHQCGCGEDHDHEEGLFVTLEDENGNEIQCEVVEGFVFEDNEFALVQNPDDGSMYLFKVVGDDEDGELVVPEEEEFNRAIAYYESLLGSDE